MMMGALLDQLARSRDDTLAHELVPDLVLLARARAAAAASGRPLHAYVLFACRRFMDAGREEAWTRLIGRFQDGADPAPCFVEAALLHSFERATACGCGHVHEERLEHPVPST